jgi:hypothetical protein
VIRYINTMRTTLTLDDDVAEAARSIAARDGRTLGDVVSDLARQSLRRRGPALTTRNGLPLLPSRGKRGSVTLELVNSIRDEEW